MNKNITYLQQNRIDKWDGSQVLSLFPEGRVGSMSFKSHGETNRSSEEYHCAMKVLDDLKVPRNNDEGEEFSIVGRIQWISEKTK